MKKDVIELYGNSDQQLNNAIDKITVEIIGKRNKDKKCQIIVLTGCSPLAGTTSVSINLAIAMAATGRNTILVDCDLRKAAKYKKLNDNVKSGLANYISTSKEFLNLPEVIYQTNIANLAYVPCGESGDNPTRILCSSKMVSFLDELVEKYEYIFLDCPSISVVPDAQVVFEKADGIILVTALGETKKSQIKDANRLIKDYRDRYLGMIINKTPKDLFKVNVKNSDYYLLDKAGFQRFEKAKSYKKKRALIENDEDEVEEVDKPYKKGKKGKDNE